MDAMQRLKQADAVGRLWAKDPSLFTEDPAARNDIVERLGWLGLAARPLSAEIAEVADAAEREGVTDIVLLGMGGSSLAPLVISRILASAEGHPRLHVLDTTAPATIADTIAKLRAESTWVLVSSKSGTTIEPLSLLAIFRDWMRSQLGDEAAGSHFLAVTDPATPLESMACDDGFRAVIAAPPDVGGRYSALTSFGLVPARLVRADTDAMLGSAVAMEDACRLNAEENPGALLAAFVVDGVEEGRDKLTLATSRELRPFGLWVEQLIAESTGKQGTGVVPVLEPTPSIPTGFGADRAVVVVRFEEDDTLASWAEVARDEGSPVHEIVLADAAGIGGEFVRWEVATALIGHLLGIDPFDQPNVAEAKAATSAILEGREHGPEEAYSCAGSDVTYGGPLRVPSAPPALAEALDPLLDSLKPRDYLGLLVYLPERDELITPLEEAAKSVALATGHAVCVELGPRYLHSTGQLHKGGPDEGVFLIITTQEAEHIDVPGKPFDLGTLWRAQAEGDLAALSSHGRRVMRVDLPVADAATVRSLADTLAAMARSAAPASR